MKQELLAPSSLPVNSQFFLPRTNGRIAFSARLLSGVISAQFMNSLNLSHLFNAYEIATLYDIEDDIGTIIPNNKSHKFRNGYGIIFTVTFKKETRKNLHCNKIYLTSRISSMFLLQIYNLLN